MAQAKISIEEMMEAGMHFGHQTHRRNPKMDPYIFDAKNGIHIIDLTTTLPLIGAALEFLQETVKAGQQVIIVGTKRQASELVKSAGEKCGMPYVNERWLGGLLTNFDTIKKRLKYLTELEQKLAGETAGTITKKERVMLERQFRALMLSLGGVKNLKGLPGAIFVVDTIKDKIAVREARKLSIPVVALVDTNSDPSLVDYPIPSNDDAKRAIEYALGLIVDACSAKPTIKSDAKPAENMPNQDEAILKSEVIAKED